MIATGLYVVMPISKFSIFLPFPPLSFLNLVTRPILHSGVLSSTVEQYLDITKGNEKRFRIVICFFVFFFF